jgi:hypothetical protein
MEGLKETQDSLGQQVLQVQEEVQPILVQQVPQETQEPQVQQESLD